MGKTCRVTVNKESFHAKCGDLLLDAALANGVDLPHDCRSGVCGSCRIRLEDGKVFGGYDGDSGMIYACRARVVSDMKVMVETVPETVMVNAEVVELRRMAPDIFAVDLQLQKKLRYLSGQYTKVQFRGFPERCYSPTYPLQGAPKDRLFHYHLRQVPGGLISTALGRDIRVGHRVKLTGPFGSAFFRPKHRGRVVVVASGTGFAPMWSVVTGAIKEWPQRELVFIVTSRTLQSFYMHAALCRLARFPRVKIIPIVSDLKGAVSPAIRTGRPTEYMPELTANDVVYTAGAPAMTEAIAKIAKAAGARCYTDPFVSHGSHSSGPGLMSKLTGWLDSSRSSAMLQPMQAGAGGSRLSV
jgi:3-phenylpropionate/trans-cinnamate dioxygenase ferredoxin reductase subunit